MQLISRFKTGCLVCQYSIEQRLNQLGKITQHFANTLSQMRFGRHAIHFRQSAVDREIAEVTIENAKTHFGRIEISGE